MLVTINSYFTLSTCFRNCCVLKELKLIKLKMKENILVYNTYFSKVSTIIVKELVKKPATCGYHFILLILIYE